MIRLMPYTKVSQQLLKGIPKAKPFGRLINGRWTVGTKSLHKTRQGVKYNQFWRLKQRRLPKF